MAMSNKSDTIKKAFPEILARKMTNVSYACKEAGIARSTYYEWLQNDQEFRDACNDAIESVKDSVESVLYNKILVERDTTCTIFYAKTKMKDRGYVERTETTGKDGTPISQVNYTVEIAKARIKQLVGE